jgi:hypothetical protein
MLHQMLRNSLWATSLSPLQFEFRLNDNPQAKGSSD